MERSILDIHLVGGQTITVKMPQESVKRKRGEELGYYLQRILQENPHIQHLPTEAVQAIVIYKPNQWM